MENEKICKWCKRTDHKTKANLLCPFNKKYQVDIYKYLSYSK